MLLDLLKDKRKKILFCDGGHKANEFTYFAYKMNKGDFIGGHDYFENEVNLNVWTTCELTKDDILGTVTTLELKERYLKESTPAVWTMYEI